MTGLQPSLKKWEGGSNHFAMRLSLLATTVLYFLKAAPQQKSSPRNLQGVWRDSANLCPGWARWKRSLSVFLSSPDHRLRSEEHTSELQSHSDLVCRLLLEKKKHNTS